MGKTFHKKGFWIISSITLFIISYIMFNYTYLATLHGGSSAPFIVGTFGIIALLISYIFDLKALTITATFGYIIAFIMGVFLETEGVVLRDKGIHSLWTVWLFSYWVFIGIGLTYEFVKKIKKNHSTEVTKSKGVILYIGLLVSIVIVVGFIYAYMTKPLTVNDVYKHKPEFSGTVVEINNDTSVLVKANENDPIVKSSDVMLVPLDVKFPEASISEGDLDIGVKVKIYHNGIVKESDPAQINKAYLILFK